MAGASVRWGRVVLGGFAAELILVVLVIPIRALGGPESAVTVVAVAGSFFVFVPVAWWLCRSVPRPVLHGALMGAAAAAIYILLGVAARLFVTDSPPTPLIYYVAHALKIAAVEPAVGLRCAARVPDSNPEATKCPRATHSTTAVFLAASF